MSIRRREFIAAFGGAAAWPLAARAQQGDRVRRIGVLAALGENDPVAKTNVSAFTQALAGLGWTDARNVRMDLRWYRGDNDRIRALAPELVMSIAFCAARSRAISRCSFRPSSRWS
jgi:putative ABC transport system substrate-binding protein